MSNDESVETKMTNQHRRIFIRREQTVYRLIDYVLNGNSDGSFYFQVLREGTNLDPKQPQKKDVSYHASGLIRIKTTDKNHAIYAEPISNITGPLQVAVFSIPGIEKLDVYETVIEDSDYIIDFLGPKSTPVEFGFVIAPWDYVFPSPPMSVSIRYENIFSFTILIRPPTLPVADKDRCVFFAHFDGLFGTQQVDKDVALIAFQQKLYGTHQTILLPANGEGVRKMIFNTPMRIPPEVTIIFEDETLQAEVLEKTTALIKFKMKNRFGAYIKEDKPISRIVLSAEL